MYNDVMGSHVNTANIYIYHVMGRAAGSAKNMYNCLIGPHVNIVVYIYII